MQFRAGGLGGETLALSEATKSRGTAITALKILVETQVISELEALNRMDEWKEEHWRR